MTPGLTQRSLLLIFAVSGFSGLIYESVWSQYLKLFLGHSAYAQAMVLMIFMGGMAVGAWLLSRISSRISNLLLGYALIEGAIGIFGLLFHPLFETINRWSFSVIIPQLGSPVLVYLYKLLAALALILPQSVLLGTTFPLMCGGYIRKFPSIPGQSVSLLYFYNSLGAALALLISTFYLIDKLGLPGTLFTAGLLNIVIAIVMYGFSKQGVANADKQVHNLPRLNLSRLFLIASFLTGMSSFIYEVIWIRMLSMVLGSSTHSFELMLSAFITGLALGGYWINKYIDRLHDTVRFAGIVQILMGCFAVLTIFLYSFSFDLMSFLVQALNKTDQGYALYNLSGQTIALLIMLPTTICAGMTLPLFTLTLFKQGHGEKSIGWIYSSNTLGAIVGVLFAIFFGMPVLGLKNALLFGAVIDILLGLWLLAKSATPVTLKYPVSVSALLLLLLLYIAVIQQFNPRQMASGVYRTGQSEMANDIDILYHKDGKTASITVATDKQRYVSISTNGKPDAAIAMDTSLPPHLDEVTMILVSAIPISINPEAKTIANIGIGSGLTSQVSLAWESIRKIDTIEIEEAMVEGARFFFPETSRVFTDPRSQIHIADAKTFFSAHKNKYDIIMSEPSNPWVSGVASLFTHEFYNSITPYLNRHGIFAQWIQTYEFNIDLFISVLKSISATFPYYSIYFANDGDIVMVASMEQPVAKPDSVIFTSKAMSTHLAEIGINNIEDINFRFIGDQDLFNSLLKYNSIPANSDYYPVLDSRAPKYRFLGKSVTELLKIRLSTVPILDLLYGTRTNAETPVSVNSTIPLIFRNTDEAYKIFAMFNQETYQQDYLEYLTSIKYLKSIAANCSVTADPLTWINSLFLIMDKTVATLTVTQINQMLTGFTPFCSEYPIPNYMHTWLDYFAAIGSRNIPAMIETGRSILEQDNQLTIQSKRFVITSLLAGLIKLGQFEEAAGLWNQDTATLFMVNGDVSFEIKLLLALVDQKQSFH